MENKMKLTDEDIKKIYELMKLVDPEKKIFNYPLNETEEQNNSNEKENGLKK